jgi:hypothetical protein
MTAIWIFDDAVRLTKPKLLQLIGTMKSRVARTTPIYEATPSLVNPWYTDHGMNRRVPYPCPPFESAALSACGDSVRGRKAAIFRLDPKCGDGKENAETQRRGVQKHTNSENEKASHPKGEWIFRFEAIHYCLTLRLCASAF